MSIRPNRFRIPWEIYYRGHSFKERGDKMSDFTMDERVFQVLEIARKKSHTTLEYFAEAMGVSSRTIRNYIKQLNSDLNGIAILENEKGKGYSLSIINQQLFERLIERNNAKKDLLDSPKRRIALIIDRLINNDESYTMDELAHEMNIGRTTLVNELKRASVSLKTYNLEVQGKQNIGIQLNGKELDLRFFIIDNVYDFLYNTYPLDQDIIEAIVRVSQKYDLESTTYTRLLQFIIVMLDRLLKNHPLEEINENHHKLVDTNDYRIAQEIVKAIEKQLPIKVPKPEILFITIPIAGRRTPTNNRTMADITITEEVKSLLELIVEQVGFKKEIIIENESFFKDLQYHLTFMLNRLLFGLRLKNPLLADVKEKYPVAYKMAEIAGQVIESEYDLKVSDDELGYIAFYFGVLIAQSDIKGKRLRKAAVVCGTGRGTAKLVSTQLQRILNQETEIDLFSDQEVSEAVLADYDIVFSTVKISFESDTPLILINEIFDEKSVSRKIEKVTYMQQFKLKDDDQGHHSILKRLINRDKFFILDSTDTYHESVRKMIRNLVEKGYLDEGFVERLNEREAKGSMVFDNFIALPHTFNSNSDRIELALGVFPEKVIVDGKEIKLVFLLGIPEQQTENSEHLLVKIYDEIIHIATDKELVEYLATTKSYEGLSQYLEQASR
jgi:lichenan operon transcriptional antiterminator